MELKGTCHQMDPKTETNTQVQVKKDKKWITGSYSMNALG